MNSLDLVIIIPIAAGFIFGVFKGLIKELTSLAAIFLGIYGAKFFSPWMSDVLVNGFSFSVKTARPVAFLIVFIAIALLLLFLSRFLDKLFDSISLGGLNKFLGGLFGALKYALVISVLLNVFEVIDGKFNLVKPETKMGSVFFEPAKDMAPQLWNEAKSYQNSADKSEQKINESKEISTE